MKIVLDVFGGDNAPEEILKGAKAALEVEQGFELVLCGRKDVIEAKAGELGNIEIIDPAALLEFD